MKAGYDEWYDALVDELKYLGLDVLSAFDSYPFRKAYDEFDMTPRQAIQDYLDHIYTVVRTCVES